MGCSPTGYKTFLVCCNVAILFVGLSVLILGLKMEWAMSVLLLINIPIVMKAIKAVIATGFFISLSGMTGICGACYESLWLLIVHLLSLGVIVIMEFSLGVTLMIVKKTIENALESTNCNSMCAASVDAIILDYALPSAGLMMTIIFVEALMIYSSIKLFFYIRDSSKAGVVAAGPTIVVQNVQMQNVGAPQPAYALGPQPVYAPQMYAPNQAHPSYAPPQFAPQVIAQESTEVGQVKPPDYNTLAQDPPMYQPTVHTLAQDPPVYQPPVPTVHTTVDALTTVPKEPDGTFNPV